MIRLGSLRRVPWWARMDWVLLALAGVLCVFGIYNLQSATASVSSDFLVNQLVFFSLGTAAALAVAWIDTRVLESLSYPALFGVLLLLLLVLFVGKEINGARRWIEIGMALQPSEFAKVATILALARFLADRPRVDGYGFQDLLWATLLIGPPFLLIFVEPDLGTSVVFILICFSVLVLARIRGEALFTYVAVVLLSVPLLWKLGFIRDYQKTRVLTFLHLPGEIALLELYGGILFIFLALAALMFGLRAYRRQNRTALVVCLFLVLGFAVGSTLCLDAFYQERAAAMAQEGPAVERARKLREIREEYQPRQSEIAIGSGGLWGKGYMAGSQTQLRFLPIAWTDYIFSVFCEERGFLGALLLLGLYMALVLWALKISITSRDRFGSFVAVGCGAFFFWHAVINIAMVTRLLPVVGVTLPLFSSGGSSLIVSLMVLGLLFHVSVRSRG